MSFYADHVFPHLMDWTLGTRRFQEQREQALAPAQGNVLEIGRSDDAWVAKWQDFLNPIERVIACGCNLNRQIDALISQGGLKIDRLDRFLLPGVPRIVGEMYRGLAVSL